MITKAFYDRVLVRREQKKEEKSILKGLQKVELERVEVLHWGTDRDGNEFPAYASHGYIRKDCMGTEVGDGLWILNRGEIYAV